MPVNNMNVGKDYSLVFYDSNSGQVLDLGDVQSFRISAVKHDIKSMPYNGPPRFGYIPDGYRFSFTITRVGSALENFQLAQTAAFEAGQHVTSGYLNETVYNPDGTTSRYQYTGFVFWVGDIGDVSRDQNVKLSAEGMASQKVQLA
ncbi:hypothetical protein MKK88_01150 [Methylobacterium sp. E-005]|uniref:hypothetical protein n=1 Tax=Methylobacterium sp. E-005 TaxID=2836549 RepID=UPI001FB893DE|nr:hypothetical protein [Methylobacterium sp. E-005]MCJ2084603.1 hypothetical protein [Methylobacterium sp. E-005]